jgi:FtsH-binding integral membrane protein
MPVFEQNRSGFGAPYARSAAEVDQGLRAFMLGVYNNMVLGLAVSALVALGVNMLATTTDPSQAVARLGGVNLTAFGRTLYASPLMWVVALAPLAFIFFFSFRLDKMSAATARTTFLAFAAVMGASLSTLLIRYTGASVVQTFFVTAAAFGGLSLYGYTTQRSLSGMGSFLMMGVIGLVLASLVNIFLQSSGLQFAISAIRRSDLRGPHGLRHAEAEGDVPVRRHGRGDGLQDVRPRSPHAVSGLHQHVPVPARLHGQPEQLILSRESDAGLGESRGLFV